MSSASAINPSRQLSRIEQLPPKIIGNILKQLNKMTGTEGVVQRQDIPVIMRNIRSLACTSKAMHAKVNDLATTDIVLESLSRKYKQSPENLAAELDTVGSHHWIWEYIQRNGDLANYQVVHDIHTLVCGVLKEAKKFGLLYFEEERITPDPNPWEQTESGFLMRCSSGLHSIVTPLGKIEFRSGNCYVTGNGRVPLSVVEVLIRKFHAKFEKLESVSRYEEISRIEEVIPPSDGSGQMREIRELREISRQEAEKQIGTQKFITCDYEGLCAYQITQINGKTVPTVVRSSKKSFRDYGLLKKIWGMLEKKRLGKDPLAIEYKVIKQRPWVAPSPLCKNLSEIPKWAISWVEALQKAPLYKDLRNEDSTSRALLPKDGRVPLTLVTLHEAATAFLGKKSAWNISMFNVERRETRQEALKLRLDPETKGDLKALEEAYASVLKNMSLGWKSARLKDYSLIDDPQSEEEYTLFINEKLGDQQEIILLRSAARLSGVSDWIDTSNRWQTKDSFWGKPGPLYLWIKHEKIEEVLAALQLEVSPQTPAKDQNPLQT